MLSARYFFDRLGAVAAPADREKELAEVAEILFGGVRECND
jgi:hypothetical protein